MNPFEYQRPADLPAALAAMYGLHALQRPESLESLEAARSPGAAHSPASFLAGGTNLVDLLKAEVMSAGALVDIRRLDLRRIERAADGGLVLGALATNADTADHPLVRSQFPLLRSAILAGASPQIRNMATNGGNLLQRTRCVYFYDVAVACNKRLPGSGCPAATGLSRQHAILGASEHCVATHPSDFCVALTALDARVHVTSSRGERVIPFVDLHRLPGDRPDLDTTLEPDELITHLTVPPAGFGRHTTYLKVRERASYAFALVSVAAALDIGPDGRVRAARLALGGVAHKPWRAWDAESVLIGGLPEDAAFNEAATVALRGARPCGGPASPEGLPGNAFKIPLARRAIVRALQMAAAGVPTNTGEDALATEHA